MNPKLAAQEVIKALLDDWIDDFKSATPDDPNEIINMIGSFGQYLDEVVNGSLFEDLAKFKLEWE